MTEQERNDYTSRAIAEIKDISEKMPREKMLEEIKKEMLSHGTGPFFAEYIGSYEDLDKAIGDGCLDNPDFWKKNENAVRFTFLGGDYSTNDLIAGIFSLGNILNIIVNDEKTLLLFDEEDGEIYQNDLSQDQLAWTYWQIVLKNGAGYWNNNLK